MSDVDGESKPAAGAILSDDQVKRLKVAIAVMSAFLVIGIITLIARVVYLASGRSEQAGTIAMVSPGAPLQVDVRLPLPAGAMTKSTTLHGNRLLVHYGSPAGDGVVLVDLVTGKAVSHVRLEAGK